MAKQIQKLLFLKFGSFFNKKGEYWNKIFKFSHISQIKSV
jgi:hypothetical protein